MKIWTVNNEKEDKFLHQETEEIDFNKEDKKKLRKLARDMRKAMVGAEGIGISANQVGVNKKIFVAQVPNDQGKPKFYAVVNPKITKSSSDKITFEEGCLSVPGKYGPTERSEKITLEGFTPEGKKLKVKAWGLLARVFQHEVDHLNGKLFVDKAKEVYEYNNKNPEYQEPDSK